MMVLISKHFKTKKKQINKSNFCNCDSVCQIDTKYIFIGLDKEPWCTGYRQEFVINLTRVAEDRLTLKAGLKD